MWFDSTPLHQCVCSLTDRTLGYEPGDASSILAGRTKFLTSNIMDKEKEYLIKFRYINTGFNAHEVVRLIPGETRAVEDVLAERWKGLLCNSGGLRSIISITELKD